MFDGADLRGTDFTRTNLSNASLRNVRIGVPPVVGAVILAASLTLSITFGAIAGLAIDAVRDRLYGPGWERPAGAAGILITLVVFVIVMFWKGIDAAIKTYLWTFAVVFVATLIVRLIWGHIDVAVAARGVGLALVLALAVVSGIIARVVGGSLGAWGIAVVAILGGLAAGRANGGLAALVISVSLVLISKRALRGDHRDKSVRDLAHRIVKRWGTQFEFRRRPDRRRLLGDCRRPLRRHRGDPRGSSMGTRPRPALGLRPPGIECGRSAATRVRARSTVGSMTVGTARSM